MVRRVALGADVTLGRADATIALASRAVSRKHLRVFRGPSGAPFVEDLETRNGTFLAGARVTQPLPVGDGVTVDLGNEVRCTVERAGAGVVIEVAGTRYDAPLGPLAVGDWAFTFESAGGDAFVVLATSSGRRAAVPRRVPARAAHRARLGRRARRPSAPAPARVRVLAQRARPRRDDGLMGLFDRVRGWLQDDPEPPRSATSRSDLATSEPAQPDPFAPLAGRRRS